MLYSVRSTRTSGLNYLGTRIHLMINKTEYLRKKSWFLEFVMLLLESLKFVYQVILLTPFDMV
jgi:hypothetical protein